MRETIQSKGGTQRAKNLSAARRSEIASEAASARWNGTNKTGFKMECRSGRSALCAKEITLVASTGDQAERLLPKLNWIILRDHEKTYGYMCHECVKAHGK